MADMKVGMQTCVNPLLTEKNAPKHCMLGCHGRSEFTTTRLKPCVWRINYFLNKQGLSNWGWFDVELACIIGMMLNFWIVMYNTNLDDIGCCIICNTNK